MAAFAEHALKLGADKAVLLGRLLLLEGWQRSDFFKESELSRVWVVGREDAATRRRRQRTQRHDRLRLVRLGLVRARPASWAGDRLDQAEEFNVMRRLPPSELQAALKEMELREAAAARIFQGTPKWQAACALSACIGCGQSWARSMTRRTSCTC